MPLPADQTARVGTPADLGVRFGARLIDTVVVTVLLVVLGGLLGRAVGSFSADSAQVYLVAAMLAVLTFVVSVGYFTVLESALGATLGKRLLKLRVLGPDGAGRPSLGQALRRNLWMGTGVLRAVPVAGYALALVAQVGAIVTICLSISGDEQHRQGWHDRVAGGTRVVSLR